MSSSASAARSAFTLVEMLVVITIIAVLAGLVTVAAVRVLDTAKQTRIKTEADALDLAMKAYKEKYGSYPPCDLRVNIPVVLTAIQQHISRAFPRYPLANLSNDLKQAGVDPNNFRPDQALAFWLRGFGPDPTNPFLTADDFPIVAGTAQTSAANLRQTRQQPYFDFDRTRLQQDPYSSLLAVLNRPASAPVPLPSYFPQGVKTDFASGAPYVYFDAFNYGNPPVLNGAPASPILFNAGLNTIFLKAGIAEPYWADTNGNGLTNGSADIPPAENWANPTTFQIIASGMDGKYGSANTANTFPKLYPTGTNYDQSPPNGNLADDDNVTNFCPKARLLDAKP